MWIITLISLAVPDFTDLLNIAGSLGAAMIAFILPSVLYLKEFEGELSMPIIVANWAIMIFGGAGGIYSVYYSINKLVTE